MVADSRVSVLILAKNEAENLPQCLSTVSWANEVIVVVDGASRDATQSIAHRGADLVAVRTFDDFASQRNAALEMASGEWVFAIDADERASPELAAEVRRVTSDEKLPHNGYRVPIRSVILGRPFRFSGTQFDWPLRLFRRGAGRWVGTVHPMCPPTCERSGMSRSATPSGTGSRFATQNVLLQASTGTAGRDGPARRSTA